MAGKFVQGNWLLPNNVNASKQSNYSFDFDGSSYVDVTNLDLGTGQLRTFSMWININIGAFSALIGSDVVGGDEVISINNAYVEYRVGRGTVSIDRPSQLTANNWHHFVLTQNNSDIEIFIDGVSRATETGDATFTYWLNQGDTAQVKRIGASMAPDRYTNGKIDEVSIFSRALSSSEITTLYNSGTPGNPFDLSGDPIAYYKLGETAIGQAPGGTWNWQVPNHAQSQFSWQMQGGTSPRLAPGTTPKQLGTTHTLSTWFNTSTSAASGFFYSLSNINQGSIQTQGITPYSGLVINDNGPYVSSSTQDIRYRVNNVDLIFTIPANIDVTDGNWHNVILVRTGGTAKCYLDGQEITNPTGSLSSTEEFAFELLSSTSRGAATPQWPGKISNFVVWKSDQSANKDNIYNSGEPQSVYTATPDYWWKLDNSSTTNVLSNLVSKNSSISTYPYSERCIVMVGGLSYNTSGGGPSLMFANEVNLGESNSISIWMSGFDLQDQYINNGRIYGGVDQYKWGIFGNTNGSFIVSKFTNATTWKLWYYLGTISGEYVELTIDQSTYPSVFTTIVSSNFYNLLFVRDGNNLEVFFNNSSIGTGTFTLGESTNTLVNAIGRNGNDTSTPINNRYKMGKSLALDDVTLFNKALSASERTTLYNNGKPGDNTSLSPTAWIRMGDDVDVANNRLIDYSGNGNHVNFSNWDQLYVRDIESVTSIGSTSQSLALSSTDLGLHNPLYSQFSNSFDTTTYIDTNFAIPNWTKYAYSIWFKFNGSTIAGYDHLIGNLSSGANADGRAIIGFTGTNLYLNMGDGTNYWYSDNQSAAPLLDGNWHHIVLNVYETGQDVYVDGSLLRTYTYTGSVTTGTPATSNNFINKGGNASLNNGVDSSVDEHAVFSRLLTTAEILSIYNNGKPNDISALSPSYWWRLGDSSYTNSSNYYVFPNKIANAPDGIGNAAYKPLISADAPKVVAPGVSSGLVELDKKGDSPNSTGNSISYNILKTDQSIYTPKYVSQYTVDNNYSMAFDGVNDYFDTSNIDLGINSTLSMWFKPDANPPTDYALIGEGSYGFKYLISRQGVGFYIWIGSGTAAGTDYINYGPTITSNIVDGAWNFLSLVKKGGTVVVYLKNSNGEFSVSNTSSAWATKSMEFDRIGTRSMASPTIFFKGQIDEVAGFSEALTADQIKFDIYEASATANKSADFINNPNLPNPVAWYRMGD